MGSKTLHGDKVHRLHARIRVVRGAGNVAVLGFCMAIGFVVVATAVPQRRHALQLEKELKDASQQEQSISAVKEHRILELKALREDPEYLEIHARDRLDLCRDGETVFRFRKK